MKFHLSCVFLVLLGCAGLVKPASAADVSARDIPLGSIGGVGDVIPGTGLVVVTSVTAGAPGALAGLQVGDFIRGANGIPFTSTSTNSDDGYVGAIQDLAMALDRAEGSGGALGLQVIRSGVGGITLNVSLGTAGSLGPAWPVNTGKTAAMFEWSCDQIHAKVQASAGGEFGYNSGWFGMILLAHPDWNQTSGANPFRNSINKLRTRCENYINGRVLQPAEAYYWNGTSAVANPAYVDAGLENWDICTSAMFLALYRSKTGDTTANAVVQRSAEAIAHRIQHWKQSDDPGAPYLIGGGIGRMGHGGVHGDYSHADGIGALNIINAHALPALALLKNAGANMSTNLGLSINAFTYNSGLVEPTIEQKFRFCWNFVKTCTATSGDDNGNVGYAGAQSGWDSAGRTPGCFAGWKLYGMTANTDDTDKSTRQADYFTRTWYRQQNAHAYTLGGVALSQLAMPFLDYRRERFFQENTRLYPALARNPDGSIAYFPGRQTIVGDGGGGYLGYDNVALINAAIPVAIRTGSLPGFPAPDSARIHAWMRAPVNTWPTMAARRVVLTGGLSHSLDLDITDANGTILAPATYTAAWTHVSGPSTVTFGSAALADTTVTVSQSGTFRVNLRVTRGGYVLDEPYDLVVSATTPPADVAPSVLTNPVNLTVNPGDTATLSVTAQGSAPLLYQWRRNGVPVGAPGASSSFTIGSVSAGSAGTYDCVITNAAGTVTSASATLAVNGAGIFKFGGLWRDVFVDVAGTSVGDLTSSSKYPFFPDISGVITSAESPSDYADSYGQRWSGWINPPQTGNYRFYIACDGNAELWISTDDKRANRVLRARETSSRASRDWPASTSDESVSPQIALVAGQRYYVELLHKELFNSDNAAITWNWKSSGVWSTPAVGSAPLPGAILEYQEGGTFDDAAQPPANYPPRANDQTVIVSSLTPISVQLTGQDYRNADLTYTVFTNPTKGTLSGTAPNLIYTPSPGAAGVDSFTFKASNNLLDSEPATVTLLLFDDYVGHYKYLPVGNNWHIGWVEFSGNQLQWRNYAGVDWNLIPTATDGLFLTDNTCVYGAGLEFRFVRESGLVKKFVFESASYYRCNPLANNINVNTTRNTAVGVTLTATDVENEPLFYSVVTSPTNGTLSGSAPNLTYTPNANYVGGDSFTFKASDGTYASNIGTVTVVVSAPTVAWTTATQASVNESGTLTVTAKLSAVSGQTVSVPFTVTGTSLTSDRTITASPISIAAGATTGTVTITITTDTLDEANETVILTMGTPTNATLGATTVHTATITDDDAAPTVAWTAASQASTGETGTMTVTARLSAVSGQTVSVPFTVTGTSAAGDRTITASPISIAAGATSGTATITITTDTLDEANETVILTMGTPTNATKGATVKHTATITDDDAMPTVVLTSTSQTSTAESGTMTVTAQLSVVSGRSVAVPLTLTGTATKGTDYTISTTSITIPAGSTTGTATITILDDAFDELNETVIVTIGNVTTATKGTPNVFTGTITDDDGLATPPVVTWATANHSVAESGTTTVTATLSEVSPLPVTVPFTVAGTARSGTDYTISASPLTIPAGSLTASVTITVTDDALDEANETVILTIGSPTNATKGSAIARTVTITDDDATPTVTFTSTSQTSTSESGTMTVTVQLSAVSGRSVSVPFALTGTATKGTDYTITASPVTIPAGSLTANITITINADTIDDTDETVIMTMGTPTNATKGTTTVHTATISEVPSVPASSG